MVVTAKININAKGVSSSKGDGDSKEQGLLKGILKELKGVGGVLSKSLKLSASGLLGGGKAGALGAGIAGVGIGGFMGLQKSSQAGRNMAQGAGLVSGYEEVMLDGERKIIEFNERTGDIVRVLSEREAREEGILDETNKMLSKYTSHVSNFDSMTKNSEKQKAALFLSTENIESIQALTSAEVNLRKQLLELLQRQVRSAGGSSISISSGTRLSGNTYSEGPMSVPDNIWRGTDLQLGKGQSFMTETNKQSSWNPYVSYEVRKDA